MKGSSLLVVLAVAVFVVAIVPTANGLEDNAALIEEQGERLRYLSEVQPVELSEMITPKGVNEHHAWWHKGGGGCSPGSRFWPHCKRPRHLEEEPSENIAEELPTEGDENHAPWHRGGCFPGSRVWPRCRGWGGRGDCFPGSRLWPRCKSF